MSDKFNLKDKVAIITGSSKGIGEHIARTLAAHGAKVIVSSRSQEAVDGVAASISQEGGEATGIACHVGKEDQLKALVSKTVDTYGGVNILVNNAAVNPFYGKLTDTDSAVFDKIMNVNLKACWALSNLCYPHMEEAGGGSVINIASVEGLKPSFGLCLRNTHNMACA